MSEPTGRTTHRPDRSGYVRDWLVGPAWAAPCDDLDAVLAPQGSPWGPEGRWVLTNGPDVATLKQRLHARRPLVTDQVLPEVTEGGVVRWIAPGGGRTDEGRWARAHTGRDGLIDWSQFCYTPEYRHALAATVLEVDQAEWRTLEIACTGPFALWVADELVAQSKDVSYMEPVPHRVRVRLASGPTAVVLATWQVAFRECRHVASLRVIGQPVRVIVPSPGADETASATAEQVLDQVAVRAWAVTDGVVRLSGPRGAALVVHGPTGHPVPLRLEGGRASLRLTDLAGPQPTPDDAQEPASMLSTGETALTVRVDDDRCPVSRRLDVAVLPARHRSAPKVTTRPSGGTSCWRTSRRAAPVRLVRSPAVSATPRAPSEPRTSTHRC